MPSPPTSILSPLIDNLLKILIAALVGILTWMGTDLRESVGTLSDDIAVMKVAVAEMKVEIRHLSNGSGSVQTAR